jgi:hypothetical protein
MGKGKKPRQKRLDPKKIEISSPNKKKEDKDWDFSDIVRSKTPRH